MTSFGSGSGQSCPQCSQINFMVTSSPGGGRYGYASSCAADYTFSLEQQRGQLIFQLRQKLVLRAAELMLKCSAPNSAASSCNIWSCALRSQPPPPPPMVSPPPPPPMICFKSANSHRDQPRQGRHPRNCRRFWSRKASILVTVVTFGPSCCRRASKVPTVTGIGVVLIAILRTVLTFDPSCCRRASDVSTDYKCIIFPPSELSPLLAPYVFVALQMYRQINNHRYKPSIEP